MNNELTILKFYSEIDGEIPSLAPVDLLHLCTYLSGIYSTALQDLGYSGEVEYRIAASPRRGSLEVALWHIQGLIRDLEGPTGSAFKAAVRGASGLTVSDKIALSALLYAVIFGGRSVLDIRTNGPQPQPEHPTLVDDLKIVASTQALSPETTQKINLLIQAASKTGAKRVELIVLDEPAVPIFGGASRFDPFGLMSGEATPGVERTIRSVVRMEGPVIQGVWNGKSAQIFLGQAHTEDTHFNSLIVWTSDEPMPEIDHEVDVKAHHLKKDQLTSLSLHSPRPPEFDNIHSVVLVSGKATYR